MTLRYYGILDKIIGITGIILRQQMCGQSRWSRGRMVLDCHSPVSQRYALSPLLFLVEITELVDQILKRAANAGTIEV